LPGFYTPSSGLPIDVRVDTDEEAAAIVDAAHRLGAQHAVLIVVPVPEEAALPAAVAEAAIQQATRAADLQGIHGKAVTPFLLQRVDELTSGAARTANVALLVNSARHAGSIARELSARARRRPVNTFAPA